MWDRTVGKRVSDNKGRGLFHNSPVNPKTSFKPALVVWAYPSQMTPHTHAGWKVGAQPHMAVHTNPHCDEAWGRGSGGRWGRRGGGGGDGRAAELRTAWQRRSTLTHHAHTLTQTHTQGGGSPLPHCDSSGISGHASS